MWFALQMIALAVQLWLAFCYQRITLRRAKQVSQDARKLREIMETHALRWSDVLTAAAVLLQRTGGRMTATEAEQEQAGSFGLAVVRSNKDMTVELLPRPTPPAELN